MSATPATLLTADQPQTPAAQLSFAHLDGDHRQILERAIRRILATELAEITYAQIIDGLPTGQVAYESYIPIYGWHPIDNVHDDLCPGMLEKARQFRADFQPDILTFNSKLVHEYRGCAPGSRGFKSRLVEMVAVAVHQIAVILFELDTSLHKNDGVTEWAPPKSDSFYWSQHPNGPAPTLFHHEWYKDHEQYPRGVADMVGYWAEARILGGVVLFDRRRPDAVPCADTGTDFKVDPDAIFFHADREGVTYRIYQLLPEQRNALLNFLIAEPPPPSPLPILASADNRIRVDPEEPIAQTGIYRDIWERKELPLTWGDSRSRDVMDTLNYPTNEDWIAAGHRSRMLRQRYEEVHLRDDDE
ncbi:hypothetical protein F5144DRAFT_588200 [Chaetomium tenue]|uniref:Uncharacterized protein n=1 Tax=Chaetomium tenue TaxID=1854479 RepID=A0ACB7PL32_9PEZI|nr:hypothetical protein F5144DRAFT_588200 [Chaetomium globosum]